MSHDKIPTILFVLPLYLRMQEALEKAAHAPSVPPGLRVAVLAGKQKLEKYHSIARGNQFYRLGTSTWLFLFPI